MIGDRVLERLADVSRQLGVALPFFLFVIGIGLLEPNFLTATNVAQVLRQATIPGVMALGVLFVVIAGRLDLSVGSLLSLTSVIIVDLHDKIGSVPAIATGVLTALLVGAVNSVLIAYLGLNSLIVTLAMMSLLQGVTMIYTGGTNVDIAAPDATWFSLIGKGYALGLPVPILILGFVSVIAFFLLHRSVFGRYVFATGGNEEATYYSGIDKRKVIAGCYLLSSLSVAVSAMILSSRVSGAQNNIGAGYELTVLAAIIIGGSSLLGGSGSVLRTLGGVILLGFVTNGLIFLGLPYYAQWLVTWVVLLASVWIDVAARRGRVFA